ncbi:D-lactate dehydrogenase [Galdieria sulphuraria]|uniref:D-lactate dehydrogenase n=1 Tax=Galdieria sulphuraria TaxID=130081 RepID=M2XDW0_GALSU|nr:D-lactate dehydrogenase [Galdieria sulphuraria]EME28187.1 D-lactate dehydrogenase [Galdieria sulphuraria]|eukprot:XP_005704707.1 D-lactate dehydrogenase [Galdieria sulphuraria]
MSKSLFRVVVFSTKNYDQIGLTEALGRSSDAAPISFRFLSSRLSASTAELAKDAEAVCVFVNDTVNSEVLKILHDKGIQLIALRCAGFNNVDLKAASELGISVVRVPAYSPNAVGEFVAAQLLTLARKIHKAYNRVRENNFDLQGLVGIEIRGKKAGIVGTGKIGVATAKVLKGLGLELFGFDVFHNQEFIDLGGQYLSLDELLSQSDIVSLHCPLNESTKYLIRSETIAKMKSGAYLINTSRGALLDTQAVLDALYSGHIGALAIDVYEGEGDLFFEDRSGAIVHDPILAKLQALPNVLVTGHQAFLTDVALRNICNITIDNLSNFYYQRPLKNKVDPK